MWRNYVLKISLAVFFLSLILAVGASMNWVWSRFGPSNHAVYTMKAAELPLVKTVSQTPTLCDLTVRHYRQIGNEVQFELYAGQGGLAPYWVEVTQKGQKYEFPQVSHRAGTWLNLTNLRLQDGPATIRIKSLNDAQCETSAEFNYDGKRTNEILPINRWIRQGSEDILLDVRPIQYKGKVYLKDFANYQDGRTKVYLIDNIMVKGLEDGLEVQPGYFYSVTACWIDAPYSEWWNHLRNRSIRQQNIWLNGTPTPPKVTTSLTRVAIPDWFTLSREYTVLFDTQFPEFEPIEGKFALQYRLNVDVPAQNYFNRGITHLPKWEAGIPPEKTHWTEPPGFFLDKDQAWFESLNKAEVEAYADGVYPSGVYAMDFEFWNRDYSPAVKQRLIWFVQRIKKNHPSMHIFDYWGGSAYHNSNFWFEKSINPSEFKKDYSYPTYTPGSPTVVPLPNGQTLADYYSITPVDIYPKAFFSDDPDGVTPNNYRLLGAIHTARINRLFEKQKNNKTIWFGWNRYLPQFRDPTIPYVISTTNPVGQLQFNGIPTMPASQALAFSMFSLVESDGFYLWHDSQPQGKGVNNYILNDSDPFGFQWFPADGKAEISQLAKPKDQPDAPRYWDYPTEFYVLGNWMVKQVEDVLVGGKKVDLDFKVNGTWTKASVDQAVVSADKHLPFVLAVVKGDQVIVLAVDSFQQPTNYQKVEIRLPNGKTDEIQLFGNWPSLYRGKL